MSTPPAENDQHILNATSETKHVVATEGPSVGEEEEAIRIVEEVEADPIAKVGEEPVNETKPEAERIEKPRPEEGDEKVEWDIERLQDETKFTLGVSQDGNDGSMGEKEAGKETHDSKPSRALGRDEGSGSPAYEVSTLSTENVSTVDGMAESSNATDDLIRSISGVSPGPYSALLRPPTPSSRTSTPPLTASGLAPVAKKFSSINVNKKFLSKTIGPATGLPLTSAKSGSLGSRPAASPVPISSASSRLLSSKLTTVPSSRSSVSPNLPSSAGGGSTSTSPWAKPATVAPSDQAPEPQTLHQPVPRQSRTLSSTVPVAMGSGLGIAASALRPAWRQVPLEGRRAPLGISRDFPTTDEIAEGKRAQARAAQAQAAHNQAILQGINAFTQLDPSAHRWDDEDDDDDPIDFGDGTTYFPQEHLDPSISLQTEQVEEPVLKSERFAEDFDRSWPPRPPPAIELPLPLKLPKRPESDSRVLFNASLNRLEASSSRLPQPAQQPRLMSRQEASATETEAKPLDSARLLHRPLPPHLQEDGQEQSRMLPPHMTPPVARLSRSSQDTVLETTSGGRQPWGLQRELQDQQALQLAVRKAPATQAVSSSADQLASITQLPRQSSSQPGLSALPPVFPGPPAASLPINPSPAASAGPPLDQQTAEMHNAAEKARLRRLAEETDREAAAERARQKAKELELRLGLKTTIAGPKSTEVISRPGAPPSIAKPSPIPAISIATRPKPAADAAEPSLSPVNAILPFAGLPTRPSSDARVEGTSWRTRAIASGAAPSEDTKDRSLEPSLVKPANARIARPSAGSFFEQSSALERSAEVLRQAQSYGDEKVKREQTVQIPNMSLPLAPSFAEAIATMPAEVEQSLLFKKESSFDSMLARIQAAMAEARFQAIPPSPTFAPVVSSAEVGQSKRTQSNGVKDPAIDLERRRASLTPQSPSMFSPLPHKANVPPMTALRPEYFDVTQTLPPKSPPPAWRTYVVRIPRSSASRSPLATWQLDAPENADTPPPGWLMSFDPPIEQLPPKSMSRSDLLLPQPIQRRFGRFVDIGPLVSISPRTLEPYAKKGKKKVSEISRPREVVVPTNAAESLLPSGTNISAAGPSRIRANGNLPTATGERWKAEVSNRVPNTSLSTRATQSPVKVSSSGTSESEGNGFGLPQRGRLPLDNKPGVRFMVSSELEGDSLLDEVNKMSLEAVDEGEDKGDDVLRDGGSKTPGTETPRTPPSVGGMSSRGNPSSPNGISTPWTRSSRSSSQHDHLKSVWDHTPDTVIEARATTESFGAQISGFISQNQLADALTPMYPSLNAPSSDDPPAQQSLPASSKIGHPNSQTFSSPGKVPPSTSYRQNPGYSYNGYTSPDGGQSTMGLSYASLGGARPNGSIVNGTSGVQQAVWSPSAFGTGYGYGTKPISSIDHKAVPAYTSAASSRDQAQMFQATYGQQHQSPQGYPAALSPQAYVGPSTYGNTQAQLSTPYGGGGRSHQYSAPISTEMAGRTGSGKHGREHIMGATGGYGESSGYHGGLAGQPVQDSYQSYGGHGAIGQEGRAGGITGVGQVQAAREMW